MKATGIACFVLLYFSTIVTGADMTCDPAFPCEMNPCMYTKCSAGFECLNCNCTYHCVPVSKEGTLLTILDG